MSELDGVIDLHLRAGPDVRPRKLDLLALARAAKAAGMRGLLVQFRAQGFTESDLDLMARRTPARLLGLDPW
jgi:hypothetical protein